MKFKISNKEFSKSTCPFILAEVACSHDGDIEKVKVMIDAAAKAGADGIQFQLFSTNKLLVPSHQFYKLVKSLEISFDEWKSLIKYAKTKGLIVFANLLEESAFESAIDAQVDVLKLHSSDLSNPEMLHKVANSKLPIVLSTGGSTIEEIRKSVEELRSAGVSEMILMHGFQAFPTKLEESHLNYILTLENLFGFPVGYQDHVSAESKMARIVPLLAMAKGAILLEKHITDDRGRKGTDHESALNPDEFVEFVSSIREAWNAFGLTHARNLSPAEIKYRKTFKKSILASRKIEEGESIKEDMICFMRGDGGLPPFEKELVLGKKANKKFEEFEIITLEFLS